MWRGDSTVPTGTKTFHHPVVGELTVGYETMPLPADPGLVLTVYSPEPASPSADAHTLLASWAATNAPDPGTESTTEATPPNP